MFSHGGGDLLVRFYTPSDFHAKFTGNYCVATIDYVACATDLFSSSNPTELITAEFEHELGHTIGLEQDPTAYDTVMSDTSLDWYPTWFTGEDYDLLDYYFGTSDGGDGDPCYDDPGCYI